MRRIALAPLLAVAGCNWVFGLEPTVALDGALPEIDAAPPRTKLVWAIASVDGSPAPPGLDPVVEYRPIGSETLYPQPPAIKVGDQDELVEAVYDDTDGSFETPEGAHRIVYVVPGDSVPHEVQWNVTDAILVVPRTTRADAPMTPPNSGYTLMPAGFAGPLSTPVAYTSGVFTASRTNAMIESTATSVTYRYAADAVPLAGPPGAPQASSGDWVLIGELVARSNEQSSFDAWTLARVDLAANMLTTPAMQPTWRTNERMLSTLSCSSTPADCLPNGDAGDTTDRIENVLGSLGGVESYAFAYGASPSTQIAAFVPGAAPTFVDEPLILPFATSTQIEATIQLADPTAELGLDRVLFARVASTRVVGGVSLVSAIQTVTKDFENKMAYPAPLATKITLGGISLSSEQPEGVTITAATGPVRLDFEAETGFVAHDYMITLYEIIGTALTPVRHYHVIASEVNIDSSLLVGTHTYVLGITARNGYGGAQSGDYQTATFPFGSTTTFTRTFIVQ